MISTMTLETRGMAAAAFAEAAKWVRVRDARDARDAVIPAAYAPIMCATPATPAVDGVLAERKRAHGNERVFMIQAGAAGAGASGPSPWRCPV